MYTGKIAFCFLFVICNTAWSHFVPDIGVTKTSDLDIGESNYQISNMRREYFLVVFSYCL